MRKDKLPTRVVVLTATLDEDGLAEAVRLGVRGLVLKELAPKLLGRTGIGVRHLIIVCPDETLSWSIG